MIPIIVALALPVLSSSDFLGKGLEAVDRAYQDYYNHETGFYSDAFSNNRREEQPSFNWGVGVWLSALNAASVADKKYVPWLRDFVAKTDRYWNSEGPVAGFDVLPVPKPKDRYYDDNMWMVMALVDSSLVLKDPKVLDRAEQTLRFVLSGEDDKLGGGIYWKENEKSSKNTCSNGPAASACLAVYSHRKKAEYLDAAKRIYAWTVKNLRDPEDGLFWDSLSLDGQIGKMKWTYNTALMIRAATDLFRHTKDSAYADDAKAMITASLSHWLKDNPTRLADDGRFAHLLLEAWIYASKTLPDIKLPTGKISEAITFLYEKVRNEQGRYPKRWDVPEPNQTRFELIDQAAAARGLIEYGFYVRSTNPSQGG